MRSSVVYIPACMIVMLSGYVVGAVHVKLSVVMDSWGECSDVDIQVDGIA